MKQKLKRIVSAFCAAAMCAGMLPPVTAAAADPDLPINGYMATQAADTATAESAYQDAFVAKTMGDGVYEVDKKNRSSALNGKIWADKSVEVGKNGTFDVTLSALGQTFASTTTTKNEVAFDVMFVLDVSGSMEDNSKNSNAVNAINDAMKVLLNGEGNQDNRVGITTFSGDSSTSLPLDHYTQDGNNEYFAYHSWSLSERYQGYYIKAKNSNGKSVSEEVTFSGGTYTQSGIATGINALIEGLEPAAAEKEHIPVLILVTDGLPTYYNNEPENMSGRRGGSGSSTNGDTHGNYTVRTAQAYKDKLQTAYSNAYPNSANKVRFYTIGQGMDKNDIFTTALLKPTKENLQAARDSSGNAKSMANALFPQNAEITNDFSYADESFVGEMNEAKMKEIFNTIISEISKVEGGENVGESTGGRNNMNFFDTLGEQVRLNGSFTLDVPTYTTADNGMQVGDPRTYTLAPHKKVSNGYEAVSGQEAQTLVNNGETLYLRPTAVKVGTGSSTALDENNKYDKAALNELEVTVRKLQNGRRQLQVSIPPDLMAYNVLNVKEANGQKTATYFESEPIQFHYDAALMDKAAAGTYLLSEPSQTYLSFMPSSAQQDGKYVMPYYWSKKAAGETAFDKTDKGTAVAGSVNYVCQSTMDSNNQVYIYLGNNGLYTLKGKTLTLDIHWNDDSNIAGKRFENISVQLYRDEVTGKDPAAPTDAPTEKTAEKVGDPVRLGLSDVLENDENLWERLFQDLPVYAANGHYYRYWLQFVPEPNQDDDRGYKVGILENSTDNGKLIQDDKNTPDDLTDDIWWFCFRTQQSGQGESLKENANLAIEFTRKAETVDLTINKEWDAATAPEEDRLGEIQLQLYANGQPVNADGTQPQENADPTPITLTKNDSWTKTLSGLPYYVEGGKGATIAYNVIEIGEAAEKYTAVPKYEVGDPDTTVKITLTNYGSLEKTALTAYKVWDDAENQDGKRPENVTFTLTANGKTATVYNAVQTVSAADAVNGVTWEDLPKNDADGRGIAYSVTETAVSGYTTTVSENRNGVVYVTNKYTPETVSITVNKAWEDGNDQDGIRPANISGVLYQQVGETGPINAVRSFATDKDTVTISGLPKYSEGQVIKYYVAENEVKGYKMSVAGATSATAQDGTTVYPVTITDKTGEITLTNKRTPNTLTYTVDFVWEDDNNRDKQRPQTLKLTLTGEGQDAQTVYTIDVTLSTPNDGTNGVTKVTGTTGTDGITGLLCAVTNGTLTISGLPEYKNGVQLDYSAALEKASPYTDIKTGMTADSSQFTLSYQTAPLTLSFTKQWANDENAPSGARPSAYAYLDYLTLYQNEVKVENPTVKSVNNGNDTYTITYSGLPKYDDSGKAYTYKVTESAVPNYTASPETVTLKNGETPNITNTYSYTQEFYETITVEKQWQDTDGSSNRPAIPENAEKDPLNIRLYRTDGSQTDENAGIQPDKIEQKSDDPNVWVYTWNKVPKTDNAGKQLLYTAYENAALEDYVATTKYVNVTADGTAQGAIVNTLNSGAVSRGSLTIKKEWKADESYQDKRPDSLTFSVVGKYKGGANDIARTVTMQKDDWTVTVDNLPLSVNGKQVTYTVTENNVPVGYTPEYPAGVTLNETAPTEITVANTYTPDKFNLTYNGNGAVGAPPEDKTEYTKVSNTATLKNQGELTYEGMVFLGWSESITPIVTTAEQKEALKNSILTEGSAYTVEGETILYAVWAQDENEDGKPDYEQKTVTVNIVWQDGGNVCGIRPNEVSFTLNGTQYTVDLADATGVLVNTNGGNTEWTYAVPDKFAVDAGLTADMLTAVTVEAKPHEDTGDTEGYTSAVEYANDVFTITLTHTPETTTHTVNKTWENESTEVTPTGATVVLYANGVEVEDSTKTLAYSENGTTTDKWEALPKYEGGHLITYHAVETSVPGADDAELMKHFKVAYDWDDANHQTNIKNTFTNKRSITMLYEWDDDNNAAGTRPTKITVQLYNGDTPVGEAVAITPDGNWSATWDELPKNGNYTAKVIGYMDAKGEHEVDLGAETQPEELGDSGYDFQMFSFGEGSVFVAESALDNVTEVTVTKNWNDSENKFGTRPEKIWVNLLKNGVIEKSAELKAENGWTHEWTGLTAYENHSKVVYTVQEIPVPGYTSAVDGTTITNTLNTSGDLKVTYVYNNGQANTTETVAYGGTAKGNTPTWNGHVFKGWYTDNGTFKNAYDFTAAVTKDITLYAKWVSSHDGKEDEDDHHFLTFVYENASATQTDDAKTPIDTSKEKIKVNCKDDFSFIAAANSGYILNTPSAAGAAKLVSNGKQQFTLENITSDITVTITAERKTSGGGGGGGGGGSSSGGNTKPQLEKGDHFAYIVGYEDGTVRPGNNITRAEVAAIFFRLLTEESRDAYYQKTNDFTDVTQGKWYNNAVSTLSNAGIISGYLDGTFRPNAPITRAELATIASKFDELEGGSCRLTDIAGHWAEEYIISAYTKGWVGGYPDGTYQPNKSITRAEVMTLVNNVLERHVQAEDMLDDMISWVDNPKTAWYYEAVQEATNSHDYSREKDEKYEKWTKITPPRDWSKLER